MVAMLLVELTDVVETRSGRGVEGVGVGSRDCRGHLRGRAAAKHVAVAAHWNRNKRFRLVSHIRGIVRKSVAYQTNTFVVSILP